ncbi:unnamed protein product [Closterium sp. Naga37s-1]|nr:unnamed protein product [Closterium sp. Naga37s-1]
MAPGINIATCAPRVRAECLDRNVRSRSHGLPSISQPVPAKSSQSLSLKNAAARAQSPIPALSSRRLDQDQSDATTLSSVRAASALQSLDAPLAETPDALPPEVPYTVVMKFGGSSVANAARMKEVADLIQSFPEENPIIVMSAMGKTTNNLIKVGERALTCGSAKCAAIDELRVIRELHVSTMEELGVECAEVHELMHELQQLVTGIALMRELTPRSSDYLVSFGERCSTRIFAAYLNSLGVPSKQFDAFQMGVITTDEFTNADVLDETSIAAASLPMCPLVHPSPSPSSRFPASPPARPFDAFQMGVITTDEFTNADVLDETYPACAVKSTLPPLPSSPPHNPPSLHPIPQFDAFQMGVITTDEFTNADFDAFHMGVITTDEFTNADVLDETYPTVANSLLSAYHAHRESAAASGDDSSSRAFIPVVTGFLGRGKKTGATTTLGRGGSDLTATIIGRALGLREVQVWKDVDGVLTCDPNLHRSAVAVPFLTFEEASELAYFGAQVLHPQSMRPAREGNIPVRVKNSYNRSAPGTLITQERDLSSALLTSIVVKRGVTLLDLVSLRMLGQFGFLAKVFAIFEAQGISVDVVATSEVSLSLTLDPAKLWSRELIQQELDKMVEELEQVAVVKLLQRRSIISLIGNVSRSSVILEKVFGVFRRNGTNVQMISQGASKVGAAAAVVGTAERGEIPFQSAPSPLLHAQPLPPSPPLRLLVHDLCGSHARMVATAASTVETERERVSVPVVATRILVSGAATTAQAETEEVPVPASRAPVVAAAASTAQTEEVPVPVVVIDNHSEANATIVQLEFGDRLGALMDTMAALRSLGLNVVKGRVTTAGTVARNTFTITQEGGKVESAEMIEAIRGTIIANLLKYHPESGTQLAMGLTCDSPPCNSSVPTRMAITALPDNTGSELRVEAADRPGLLMEIVDVLTGMSVSVTSAEIDTEGVVAKDVFTVSYHGGPLDDEMTTLTLNALNYTLSRPDIEAEESY